MSDLIIAVPGSTGGIVLVEGIPGPAGGVASVAAVSPLAVSSSGGVSTISLTTVPVTLGGTGLMAAGAVGTVLGVISAGVLGYGAVNLANAASVTGLLPVTNVAPSSTTGQVLTTTVGGSTVAWAAVNAITQLTGDVTAGPGTGSVAATVVRVNGATVPAAGALTTGNSAYVSGASALTYSALNLAGGSGWVSGLLPLGNQAAPTGTGPALISAGAWAAASGPIQLASGSTWVTGSLPLGNQAAPTGTGPVTVAAGAWSTASAPIQLNGGATWVTGNLPVTNVAPSGTNGQVLTTTAGATGWATLSVPVSDIVPGTAGQLLVTNAGATAAAWVSASQDATLAASGAFTVTQAQNGAVTFASGTGLIGFASADTGPGLSQASTSGATGANLVLTSQASTNANGTPGSVVVALTAPTGSGSEAAFVVRRGSANQVSIGPYPGSGSSYAGIWLQPSGTAPTGSNVVLLSDGSSTILNAPSASASMYFRLGASTAVGATVSSAGWQFLTSSATDFGGGVGVISLGNATTLPTTAPSASCVLAAHSGTLAVYDTSAAAANIAIASYGFLSSANANNGGIGWTQSANTVASGTAVNMTLAAQSATGGGASFGGSLNLSSGSAATAGSINLQIGGTTAIQISSNGSVYLQNSASGLIAFASSVSGAGNPMTLSAQTSSAGTGGNFTGEAGGGVTGGNLLMYAGSGSTTNGSLVISTFLGAGTPGTWYFNGPALATSGSSDTGGFAVPSLVKGFPVTVNGVAVKFLVCLP